MTRAWRLAFASLYVVVGVVGAWLGIRIVVGAYTPIPFADFWDQFSLIERGLDGDIGPTDLWAQWNEHRIPLARLQFLADYGLFGGTNVFLFGVIAASLAALAALFALAVWLETRDWLLTLGTLAAGVAAMLSPAGIENLTWAFQVAFVQAFLFAVAAILAVVVAARCATTSRGAIAAGVCAVAGAAATYSLANGLLVWVIVLALAVLLGLERRLVALVAVVGALSIGTYLWQFEFTTRGNLSDPVGLIHFVAVYLGSVVWGAGELSAAIVGAAGLILLPIVCVVAWRARHRSSVVAPFGAGVAAFLVLTAAQTAAGRLSLGVSQALASRYSLAAATFWLGLLVGLLPVVRERARRAPLLAPAYLAAAGLVAVTVGYRLVPADSFVRGVVVGRQLTVVAYRSGVEDGSGLNPAGQAGPGVRNALRWLERERLGPWTPGGLVDEAAVVEGVGTTALTCSGAIERIEPVVGGLRIDGWVDTPDDDSASRHLVVADETGARVGYGLVGHYRPDARDLGAGDDWRGFVAYAAGEPSAVDVVLPDEDGVRATCRLPAEVSG